VKEEGPKEMTLDEWKAMQDKERAKVEFNIRKPNEGADSQWKKGYVLHKSKSEDVSSGTSLPRYIDVAMIPATMPHTRGLVRGFSTDTDRRNDMTWTMGHMHG